jgi:hypothetical protein
MRRCRARRRTERTPRPCGNRPRGWRGEGGGVGALHRAWAAGQRVVGHPLGDDGAVLVKVFPAEIALTRFAIRSADAGFRDGAAALARQADADHALADRKHDAASDVVPSIPLIALHDRKLHAVDQQQFLQRQAERLRHQDVDFDQCHAASEVASQGATAGPGAGEILPEVLRQAGVVGLAPLLVGEGEVVDFFPEDGVVGGEAVEASGARRRCYKMPDGHAGQC